MEYKSMVSAVKQIEDRTVTGITAVMGNVDDGGDRIFNGAFSKTLREHIGRVQHLWQHDASQPPTAVIKSAVEVGIVDLPSELVDKHPMATGGLQVEREYLDTPRGNEILRGIAAGAIKEMSFGYDPIKFDFEEIQLPNGRAMVRNLREIRLWDTSDVNWGMNPATVASKALDLGETPTFEQISAAMAELVSGTKTYDSEMERRLVYNQLISHYKQFDHEPPSYALVEMAHIVRGMETELKAGRVLSASNLNRLKEAIETLREILAAAEPQDDPAKVAALTARVLRKLAFAERDPLLLTVR